MIMVKLLSNILPYGMPFFRSWHWITEIRCQGRAFPIDKGSVALKFKLKFGLRPYFFYFSLPLFKTLPSDSLFLTLFYLNIHSLFIFYYFLLYFTTPKIPSFPIFLPHSLSVAVVFPLPFFFFFFFPTTHVPLLFSFFFLSFFSPPPTYPLPFFLLLPHQTYPPSLFLLLLTVRPLPHFSLFFFFFLCSSTTATALTLR
jgi:hypothetical protein